MTPGSGQDPNKAFLEKTKQEKNEAVERRNEIFQEFASHSLHHGQVPASNRPTPVPGYANKAAALRAGQWGGGILTIGIFAALNVMALEEPPLVVAVISVGVAVLIGLLARSTVSRLFQVDVFDPRSTKRTNRLLIAGGLSVIASFGAYCYLRLANSEYATPLLPWLCVAVELGGLAFVSAATELLPAFDWPEKLLREFEASDRLVKILEIKIDATKRYVEGEELSHENKSDPVTRPDVDSIDHPAAKPSKSNGSADHAGLY
ncbi:MAG: hypothetical protein ABSF15_28120 [Candidatus Sulfotelmatobacter sp.]|jgi:hypothetical protein